MSAGPRIFARPPFARAIQLLDAAGLPSSDLSPSSFSHFLGCGTDSAPDGIIGLERHGSDALLRSLVVTGAARGQGCGRALVKRLEEHAAGSGVCGMYLLTETAEVFFAALGYARVDRADVPAAIRASSEFSCLCPDDAVVMCKRLAPRRADEGDC